MNATAWMLLIGATTAMACAVPGTWLVLRRQSLFADALTHAILPGLAAGYLLTGQRGWHIMLAGALICGMITIVVAEEIKRLGRLDSQAALGVVFSTLFALGLIMVKFASKTDLDIDCVLAGRLEFLGYRNHAWLEIFGVALPRPFVLTCGSFVISVVLTLVLYKEWCVSSFDPAYAASMSLKPRLMHFLLSLMSTIACISSFQSVGVVLVLAMLIVPPVIALQFTRKLSVALLLSVVIAASCAPLGWLTSDMTRVIASHIFAPALQIEQGQMGTPPMAPGMAVASGVLLVACLGFKALLVHTRYQTLRFRIALEDALATLWRQQNEQSTRLIATNMRTRIALWWATRKGLLNSQQLTRSGQRIAQKLVASHRLWETYLVQKGASVKGSEHVSAHLLEHLTTDAQLEDLLNITDAPEKDPHGKSIPPHQV